MHFPAAPCVAWGKRTWLRISDHELAWLVLPNFFSLGSISPRTDGPGTLDRVGLWQLFQFLPRGLVDVFFPRGFGHAPLIHVLFDAS
jgi:hypothetical protein